MNSPPSSPAAALPPLPPSLERAGVETYFAQLPTGIRLSVRACGPAPAEHPNTPTVVFLHGFPEAAFVWDEVLLSLGLDPAAPVRCVAPNLRGFECSGAPGEVEAYKAKHIVADVAALLQIVSPDKPVAALVAHDWGGAVAWNLAIAQSQGKLPRLIERLVIMNSPHPYTFWRELMHSPEQQAASAYMNFLCRPDAPRLLSENDYARLWPFFTNTALTGTHVCEAVNSGQHWLTEPVKDQFRAVWGMGLAGGCNYYRASPLKPADLQTVGAAQVQLKPEDFRITLPVHVLWGLGDIALRPELLDGLEACIDQLQVERLPNASHWLVHEHPSKVAAFVRASLGQH